MSVQVNEQYTRTVTITDDPSPSTRLREVQDRMGMDEIEQILAKHDRGESLNAEERQVLKTFQGAAPQYKEALQQVTRDLANDLKRATDASAKVDTLKARVKEVPLGLLSRVKAALTPSTKTAYVAISAIAATGAAATWYVANFGMPNMDSFPSFLNTTDPGLIPANHTTLAAQCPVENTAMTAYYG